MFGSTPPSGVPLLTGVPSMMRPSTAAFMSAAQQQQAQAAAQAAHFTNLISFSAQQQHAAAAQQMRIQMQIQQAHAAAAQVAQQQSMLQAASPAATGSTAAPFQVTFPPIVMSLEVCGAATVAPPLYYQRYTDGDEKNLLCSTCQLNIPTGDVMLSVANLSTRPLAKSPLTHHSHLHHHHHHTAHANAHHDTDTKTNLDADDLPVVKTEPGIDSDTSDPHLPPPPPSAASVASSQTTRGPTFYRHLECAQLHHLAHEPDNAKIGGFARLTPHQQMIVHHRLNFVRAKAYPLAPAQQAATAAANGFGFFPQPTSSKETAGASTGATSAAATAAATAAAATAVANEAKKRAREELELELARVRQRLAKRKAAAAAGDGVGDGDGDDADGDDLDCTEDDDLKLELALLREKLAERERLLDARERGESVDGLGPDGEPVKPRRKRAKKDPLAPKRPASNYMFWCMYRRPQLKAAAPDVNSNVLMRKMALEWKSMEKTPESMRRWDEMHEKDQARYRRQMAEWRLKGTYTEEKSEVGEPDAADAEADKAMEDHEYDDADDPDADMDLPPMDADELPRPSSPSSASETKSTPPRAARRGANADGSAHIARRYSSSSESDANVEGEAVPALAALAEAERAEAADAKANIPRGGPEVRKQRTATPSDVDVKAISGAGANQEASLTDLLFAVSTVQKRE